VNLSTEQLFEIAQYSLVRIDGACFFASAREFGKEMPNKQNKLSD
jgi:hypothetical protein